MNRISGVQGWGPVWGSAPTIFQSCEYLLFYAYLFIGIRRIANDMPPQF
ncbi:MAG TPA: hypothetical protein VD993_17725 [Chitinophagaceae bacterium]|nr:hypothetical protein [Chitinophagaceae bacterium]